MAKPSPFGAPARQAALQEYLAAAGAVTPDNAWAHIYHLLLSIDRRTGLAHIYDANHMQPGGTFHTRARRFTELLIERWRTTADELPGVVDFMFAYCTEIFRADNPDKLFDLPFVDEVEALLRELGVSHDRIRETALDLGRLATEFYVLGRKRQNVRGEGFEDVIAWLVLNVGHLPQRQLRVRLRAHDLPGFRKAAGKKRKSDKVPSPDLVVLSPDEQLTMSIITAKWSLRQDRMDQFGQEFEYYKGNRTQDADIRCFLVTNEMDVARLRGILTPPPGRGGFHFDRVYHVNPSLLEETQGKERFDPLCVYIQEGRLAPISDLLLYVARMHS